MKKIKRESQSGYKLRILGQTIITGPGTVPTSAGSVAETSIKDVIALSRKASREGIFETKESDNYGFIQNLAK